MNRVSASLAVLLLGTPLLFADSAAVTEIDLSDRLMIDGVTDEWALDESIFQTSFVLDESDSLVEVAEEPINDSKWGFFNDINQVRVSWDARFLYVAVDAIIWGNNIILLFDYQPGGMSEMTNLNSWRRNFVFQGFDPDLFLATWDTNTLPQLWTVVGPRDVRQFDATEFQTVASFDQDNINRSMEAAIPWEFVLGEDAGPVFDPAYADSVFVLPNRVDTLRVVCVLTAGPDGTGGPDSAPDNLNGHTIESSDEVQIDNWANIRLDLDGPEGLPDRVPDFGVSVRDTTRFSFRVQPPVPGLRLEIRDITFTNGAVISPEQSGKLDFTFRLLPEVIPEKQKDRPVKFSADVFNLKGDRVRSIYRDEFRRASEPLDRLRDSWDGRDDQGRIVEGGVYILRLVIEKNIDRKTKAFSVVR
jgi:hypothetical protein